jgi:hypothetical protein
MAGFPSRLRDDSCNTSAPAGARFDLPEEHVLAGGRTRRLTRRISRYAGESGLRPSKTPRPSARQGASLGPRTDWMANVPRQKHRATAASCQQHSSWVDSDARGSVARGAASRASRGSNTSITSRFHPRMRRADPMLRCVITGHHALPDPQGKLDVEHVEERGDALSGHADGAHRGFLDDRTR